MKRNMEFKFMILHERWSMKQTWIIMPHSRHSGRYLSPCCVHILQRRAKIEVLVTSFGKYWVISNRTILLTISIVCESKRLPFLCPFLSLHNTVHQWDVFAIPCLIQWGDLHHLSALHLPKRLRNSRKCYNVNAKFSDPKHGT